MLTAEIKINGALLGYLYIHNEGDVYKKIHPVKGTERCQYYAEYYEIGKPIKSVRLEHDREDGALVLIQKAIKLLLKEKE